MKRRSIYEAIEEKAKQSDSRIFYIDPQKDTVILQNTTTVNPVPYKSK